MTAFELFLILFVTLYSLAPTAQAQVPTQLSVDVEQNVNFGQWESQSKTKSLWWKYAVPESKLEEVATPEDLQILRDNNLIKDGKLDVKKLNQYDKLSQTFNMDSATFQNGKRITKDGKGDVSCDLSTNSRGPIKSGAGFTAKRVQYDENYFQIFPASIFGQQHFGRGVMARYDLVQPDGTVVGAIQCFKAPRGKGVRAKPLTLAEIAKQFKGWLKLSERGDAADPGASAPDAAKAHAAAPDTNETQ